MDDIELEERDLVGGGAAGRRRYSNPVPLFTRVVGFVILILMAIITVCVAVQAFTNHDPYPPTQSARAIPATAVNRSSEAVCQPPPDLEHTYEAHMPVLIKNGRVLVGDKQGTTYENHDVLLMNGRISQIEPSGTISAPAGTVVIDAKDKVVTPGVQDCHAHAAVDSYPETFGTADVNELTDPVTPGVRVIDAFNPHDPAISDIVGGGVTTIQVLPGSGNAMGGQGHLFKTWPRTSGRATIPHMAVKRPYTVLKMACGENPKRVYGRRKMTPGSRLGAAWVMRKELALARALRDKQDQWCEGSDSSSSYPRDLTLQPLVDLLRGHAVLNVHCYKALDIRMLLRLADEFGFRVSSVHHAHESFQVADELAKRGIVSALFADQYAYKMEALEGRPDAAVILDEAGAGVAFKSDHPVTSSRDLMAQAGIGYHFGLSEAASLAAVTSVPAEAIGLGERTGRIAKGLDADVVVWDRHPLAVGARPTHVFIEGVLVVEREPQYGVPPEAPSQRVQAPVRALFNATTWQPEEVLNKLCRDPPSSGFVIRGATVHQLLRDTPSGGVNGVVGSVAVDGNGVVVCVEPSATGCSSAGGVVVKVDSSYHLIPGMISADAEARLGDEVLSEDSGTDGVAGPDGQASRLELSMERGGIRGSTRLGRNVFGDGILSSLRSPAYSGIVGGIGAWARTGDSWFGAELEADGKGIVLEGGVGLHVRIGSNAKQDGKMVGSISGQLLELETMLTNATAVVRAAAERVLVVRVNNADEILAVLNLVKRVSYVKNLVIVGAAESHLVATQLAQSKADVVLSPALCVRNTFETIRCSLERAKLLQEAGVRVAYGEWAPEFLRGTRFRVGHEWQRGRLTETAALQSLTSNVAEFYKLPRGAGEIRPSSPAQLALYAGHPLRIGSYLAVAVDTRRVRCSPPEAPFVGYEDYKGL